MRRVMCVHLPTGPTDRIRLKSRSALPPSEPLVTAMREGSRRVLAAVDATARELGFAPGQTVAHAQAMVPNLHVVEATLDEDLAGLDRLAAWCLRYAPLVASDPPDGIWIDIAGAAICTAARPDFSAIWSRS